MTQSVAFQLNGQPVSLETDKDRTLLWVLRTDLGLTGAKYGCGVGYCGACTIVVDGEALRSCQVSLADVAGKSVTTIEGLASGSSLHPLQSAFIDQGGYQCGYCTTGMIMNAYALLHRTPQPSKTQIINAMENNLCRCGAHQRIVVAIEKAAMKKAAIEQPAELAGGES